MGSFSCQWVNQSDAHMQRCVPLGDQCCEATIKAFLAVAFSAHEGKQPSNAFISPGPT